MHQKHIITLAIFNAFKSAHGENGHFFIREISAVACTYNVTFPTPKRPVMACKVIKSSAWNRFINRSPLLIDTGAAINAG